MSQLPRYGQAFLLPNGSIAPVWYDYLRTLDSSSLTTEIERQVQANTAAIKALQQAGFGDYLPASAFVLGINSVETFGELKDGARVMLRGDVPAPDPSHYYGTDADGVRGFHPVPVTTDDLPEGVDNLYFTDARADARVDAGIAEHVAQPDPHPQYLQAGEEAVQSVNGQTGEVELAAADVGAATAAQGAKADSAVQADAPVLDPLPPDAPDDASAALADVPVGGIYRNGSILMIRTT